MSIYMTEEDIRDTIQACEDDHSTGATVVLDSGTAVLMDDYNLREDVLGTERLYQRFGPNDDWKICLPEDLSAKDAKHDIVLVCYETFRFMVTTGETNIGEVVTSLQTIFHTDIETYLRLGDDDEWKGLVEKAQEFHQFIAFDAIRVYETILAYIKTIIAPTCFLLKRIAKLEDKLPDQDQQLAVLQNDYAELQHECIELQQAKKALDEKNNKDPDV